jgi:hypothetical protein
MVFEIHDEQLLDPKGVFFVGESESFADVVYRSQ